MLLGLDFDNTLISYDRLFHKVAFERAWIPETVAPEKNAVRDYLRAAGREDDWTLLQGIVYGSRILEAEPYDGVLTTLDRLTREGVAMRIVSHKTKTPYRGEPCDLHGAARQWLDRQGFHDRRRLGWAEDAVFFELTKQDKVARIVELGCTHYVDDLPEILEMLPDHIGKIHFAPNAAAPARPEWPTLRAWAALPALIGLS
ncbi:hypothetical protein CY652_12845 [Burkholderia sp. WAC0059]|uniref:hypothetical protein n=1 Tax=Burkholderia sp. WAC0059 TaxID=2066022 RepID=UPI000C7EDF0F|nr:hypothetical protein [Burkholderia sp. WAC0059]PLZ01920.1 hypothetical protein CY652_12845 [Burkholderia sp. WAC0059]